jgi:hypothetical protein
MQRVAVHTVGFSFLLLLLSGAGFAQERFTASADGQEVTDSRTGLTWRRCAEGMVFKGKICTGQAVFLSAPDAAARAKAASAPGAEWRLPILKEREKLMSTRRR